MHITVFINYEVRNLGVYGGSKFGISQTPIEMAIVTVTTVLRRRNLEDGDHESSLLKHHSQVI